MRWPRDRRSHDLGARGHRGAGGPQRPALGCLHRPYLRPIRFSQGLEGSRAELLNSFGRKHLAIKQSVAGLSNAHRSTGTFYLNSSKCKGLELVVQVHSLKFEDVRITSMYPAEIRISFKGVLVLGSTESTDDGVHQPALYPHPSAQTRDPRKDAARDPVFRVHARPATPAPAPARPSPCPGSSSLTGGAQKDEGDETPAQHRSSSQRHSPDTGRGNKKSRLGQAQATPTPPRDPRPHHSRRWRRGGRSKEAGLGGRTGLFNAEKRAAERKRAFQAGKEPAEGESRSPLARGVIYPLPLDHRWQRSDPARAPPREWGRKLHTDSVAGAPPAGWCRPSRIPKHSQYPRNGPKESQHQFNILP
ncbi:hypothetical protein P7K49_027475 [Saguinus oedipus]|uniref:Uncharacterized protein n=1 Tax=Saguinus oedipus TaxID=9490 RepID=A0ABQ9U9J0_SAGOE|nr:hypothetical protein P7K49_027475 [Saguinus oedipus]